MVVVRECEYTHFSDLVMATTTLYDIVTSRTHCNRLQVERYLTECGDDLALLSQFLRRNTEQCWHAVDERLRRQEETGADAEPYLDDGGDSALLPGTSLLMMCVHRPRALYAYNEAIIRKCRHHMPNVDPEIFGQIRLYNFLLRTCPCAPPEMAVLVFWWIANTHRGVLQMVRSLEPPSSVWSSVENADVLGNFCHAWITATKNHDTHYMPHYAILFRFALAHVVLRQNVALARRDGRAQTERVPKGIKKEMRDAHAAALALRRAAK